MTFFVDVALLAMLLVIGAAVIRMRNLFGVVILSGIYSLVTAALFLTMDAPDVAFTESAVGVGVSTVLMLAALTFVGHEEKAPKRRRSIVPVLVVVVTGAILIYGTVDVPPFGDPNNPIHHHVAPRYLNEMQEEVDVYNAVSAVLASYRGYDTMGETAVIFTAGVGVLLMLTGVRRRLAASDRRVSPDAGEGGDG